MGAWRGCRGSAASPEGSAVGAGGVASGSSSGGGGRPSVGTLDDGASSANVVPSVRLSARRRHRDAVRSWRAISGTRNQRRPTGDFEVEAIERACGVGDRCGTTHDRSGSNAGYVESPARRRRRLTLLSRPGGDRGAGVHRVAPWLIAGRVVQAPWVGRAARMAEGAGQCATQPPSAASRSIACATYAEQLAGQLRIQASFAVCARPATCDGYQVAAFSAGYHVIRCGFDAQGALVWAERCEDAEVWCESFCTRSAHRAGDAPQLRRCRPRARATPAPIDGAGARGRPAYGLLAYWPSPPWSFASSLRFRMMNSTRRFLLQQSSLCWLQIGTVSP